MKPTLEGITHRLVDNLVAREGQAEELRGKTGDRLGAIDTRRIRSHRSRGAHAEDVRARSGRVFAGSA